MRDSKTVPAPRREALATAIRAAALCVGLGAASVREIDRLNIRVATALAMRRALLRALPRGVAAPACRIVVDGLAMSEIGLPHLAVVDGDALCYSVAAAGLVAKTVRDALMQRLARRYPGYGWETNMGYGTEEHLAGLERRGPTRHHRLTFAPVVQLVLSR